MALEKTYHFIKRHSIGAFERELNRYLYDTPNAQVEDIKVLKEEDCGLSYLAIIKHR